MERLLIAAVLVVVAVVAARLVDRRRPAAPTQPRWEAPSQLDRDDFDGGAQPWLVVVFTSATCDSCKDATAKAEVLASAEVAFQEVAWQDGKDLHDRYAVDVVPTTVMADAEGVVRASFVGPATATDLWAALAEARCPGASPEPGLGREG
ncbi:MAG: thioredoxin domain-containing protein [Acidimicrobiales bacterium]